MSIMIKKIFSITSLLVLTVILVTTMTLPASSAAPNTVMFDEAHLPYFSIGTNPAHTQGSYSEFASSLAVAGYTVTTLNPGQTLTFEALEDVCCLIIALSQDPYTTSEVDALEGYIAGGGGLLLVGDHGPYSEEVEPIANRFDISFKALSINDKLADPTDYLINQYWIVYSSKNINPHPVTDLVTRVEMYNVTSMNYLAGTPLITTDDDVYWFDTLTSAPNEPVLLALTYGQGKVVVIGDLSLWRSGENGDYDMDGADNFYDSDNYILALNTVNWLCQPITVGGVGEIATKINLALTVPWTTLAIASITIGTVLLSRKKLHIH